MKQIFTNVDFSGNTVSNIVVGSYAGPPANASDGFVYFNIVTGKLRVRTSNNDGTEGWWEDLVSTPSGKIIEVVNSFDNVSGRGDTIYLKQVSQGVYDAYAYTDSSFVRISGRAPLWEEIVGKPNILDCSYIGNENLAIRYIE